MPNRIDRDFVHLGSGARVITQPEFTGGEWYQGYGERHGNDGAEGRLVSQFTCHGDWDSWEMHPHGDEMRFCLAGRMTLHQEHADGSVATLNLSPGEYAINPPGCWHTADIEGEATAPFITAGLGTEQRERVGQGDRLRQSSCLHRHRRRSAAGSACPTTTDI